MNAGDRAALRELAEEHVRKHFQPEGQELILADEYTMDIFERRIAVKLKMRPQTQRRVDLPEEGAPRVGLFLYRLWGENDRLLYVGISRNLRARLRVHRRTYGELICRVTWEQYDDAESLIAAERKAIHDEAPAFNSAGIG